MIESSLSDTEREFVSFVERRASGRVALYQVDDDSGLPGDTVRLSMRATEGADVREHRHTVEFMSLTGDGHWEAVGCITHSSKEIEAMQGRYAEIESTFEIVGTGVRDGQFASASVEPVVQAQLEKLTTARLRPLPSRRFARNPVPSPRARAA